jgi:hypothetical protein
VWLLLESNFLLQSYLLGSFGICLEFEMLIYLKYTPLSNSASSFKIATAYNVAVECPHLTPSDKKSGFCIVLLAILASALSLKCSFTQSKLRFQTLRAASK